jgi:DNA-binding NarL/FixJ family response regulator
VRTATVRFAPRSLRAFGSIRFSAVTADKNRAVPIRLVLVEDHPALRKGLSLLLPQQGCEVVGAAADAAGGRALVAELAPTVAVVDVHLGLESGIELTRELAAAHPACRVVLYTGSEDAALVALGLEAGAMGYALKTSDILELVDAIHSAAAGRRYVDPRIASWVATQAATSPPTLSKREREVMDLLARGLTGEQIAQQLFLSAETVKTHIRNAMCKLEATTRVHAVALGLASGELTSPGAI